MAKARRPPFAAADRFLGFSRGGAAVFPSSGGDDDLPDLAEADVLYSSPSEPGRRPAPDDDDEAAGSREEEGEEKASAGRAPRRGVGGLSRAFGDDGRQQHQVAASSAPVAVPAWPSRFAAAEQEALFVEAEPKEDEEGGAGGWVPPHVYLARRQARASVVEGAGRTLKGRDMSRVRDAVWSRTGFYG